MRLGVKVSFRKLTTISILLWHWGANGNGYATPLSNEEIKARTEYNIELYEQLMEASNELEKSSYRSTFDDWIKGINADKNLNKDFDWRCMVNSQLEHRLKTEISENANRIQPINVKYSIDKGSIKNSSLNKIVLDCINLITKDRKSVV